MNTLKEKNIIYETKTYWVRKIKDGFEIYRKEMCYSVRCGQVGFTGDIGLKKAIRWIETHHSNN